MVQPVVPRKVSHRKIFIIGGVVALVMFAFCFAMVPLYTMICKAAGLNSTAINSDLSRKPNAAVAQLLAANLNKPNTSKALVGPTQERKVTVQFVSTNHNGMPWDFYPRQRSVEVSLGENITVYFHAKNATEKNMIAQAIPSMTPTIALNHFHKIECFCFQQQMLKAGQSKEMALIFHVD